MTAHGIITSHLFSPLTLRGITLANRIVVSPMCQYQAADGLANDWHFSHLAKFAAGGAGLVFTEATAIEPRGRISPGDLGIWKDEHVPPLSRIAEFLRACGAAPGIQLAHSGRKGSARRPWHGGGPLDGEDVTLRGEKAWATVAPTAEPAAPGWPAPIELDRDGIRSLVSAYRRAVRRALAAGFEVVEIHGAHGYLIHEFLSPASNRRNDSYGGDLAGRMRFALEVAEAVRDEWPEDKPVVFRVSAVDGGGGGWTLDDTVALARALGERGVDVIDCSAGGIASRVQALAEPHEPGFQVPYAEAVRTGAGVKTMAVGLIAEATLAEAIVREGRADLVAVGREFLFDPNWPLHAALELGIDPDYALWPVPYGWWLARRARHARSLEEAAGTRAGREGTAG